MATKTAVSQGSKKTIGSLTRRSCQAGTIPKRQMHGMKTRSMAKAAAVIVVRQTMTPSSKQQDLQQKCLVGESQRPLEAANSTL